MEEPKSPKLSNSRIRFGMYNELNIKTIYTGTIDVPFQLLQVWFNNLLRYETKPDKFKCSNLQELFMVSEEIGGKAIGQKLMQKLVEDKFYKLAASNTYKFYPDNKDASVNLEDEANLWDDSEFYLESNEFNKELYQTNLLTPMTEADCDFFEFEFAKNYITMSCIGEVDLSLYDINIETIVSDIIKKYFNGSQWFLDANNPTLFDMQAIQPAYSSEFKRFVILCGAPSYLDWLMSNGKIYFRPETIKKLEGLEVNLMPRIELETINSEIVKWNLVYEKAFFRFSALAKEASTNLFYGYCLDLERYKAWVVRGQVNDESDYTPSWKYSDQDFIDDAFGGEADACWNID